MNSVNVGRYNDFQTSAGRTNVRFACDRIDESASVIHGDETEMENRCLVSMTREALRMEDVWTR